MYDIEKLPFGNEYNPPERIVCAANKYGDGCTLKEKEIMYCIKYLKKGCLL